MIIDDDITPHNSSWSAASKRVKEREIECETKRERVRERKKPQPRERERERERELGIFSMGFESVTFSFLVLIVIKPNKKNW